VLAAIGVYGVMAYGVTQRTHEIGVRMALGAGQADVLRLVVRQALLLTVVGLVIGILGALAVTGSMSGLLYGITATDPMTYISISLGLAAVAALASYLPARRATRVDPMVALRTQ
jgi:ABC-type antimicrobial peptide transport system permease subunit